MNIKFKMLDKRLPLPTRGTPLSAGIDLCMSRFDHTDFGVLEIGLGVAVEIPEGHYGLLAIRSSVGAKGMYLTNGVGIIDQDYRGELMLKCVYEYSGFDFPEIGDRIAQLVVQPYLVGDIIEVDELDKTKRGDGSYGSTGN